MPHVRLFLRLCERRELRARWWAAVDLDEALKSRIQRLEEIFHRNGNRALKVFVAIDDEVEWGKLSVETEKVPGVEARDPHAELDLRSVFGRQLAREQVANVNRHRWALDLDTARLSDKRIGRGPTTVVVAFDEAHSARLKPGVNCKRRSGPFFDEVALAHCE